MKNVEDLRVLVTGGGRGIGRAIVDRFKSAGAAVFTCDIDAALLSSSEVPSGVLDVADAQGVADFFGQVKRELGGLDVLVNNAGIAGPMGRIDTIERDEWLRVLDVNLNGAFYCSQCAVPLLIEAGGGSIINISSAAGRVPYPLRSPYSTSKFALVGLTQCLAAELGDLNIRANAILPGIVRGERRLGNSRRRAQAEGISVEEVEARSLTKVALGRAVEADEIASTVMFLASPAAANITGQSISVDGYLQALTEFPRYPRRDG